MKKLLPILLILGFNAGFNAHALELNVSKAKPLQKELASKKAFSLKVENPKGPIRLLETKGTKIEISAKTEFVQTIPIAVDGLDTDSVKVEVKYPDVADGGDADIIIGNSRSTIIAGKNATIIIDGKVVQQGAGKASVALTIGIPSALLSDINLVADHGSLEIDGAFDNEFADTREAFGTTSHAAIRCMKLKALGGIGLKTIHGSITLQATHGDCTLSTSHASINAEGNHGNLEGKTSHGSITVTGQVGELVDVDTSHDSIKLNNPEVEEERATTTHGKVTFTKK